MSQALALSLIVTAQLAVTFIMQIITIREIGAGSDTDALLATQAIQIFLFSVVATALQGVWLSRFSRVAKRERHFWRASLSVSLGQTIILGLAICLFSLCLAHFALPKIFPGFDESMLETCFDLLMIFLISFVLNLVMHLATLGLRSLDRFYTAELTSLAMSTASIFVLYLLLPRCGVMSLAWAGLFRSVTSVVLLLSYCGWPGFNFKKALRDTRSWQGMKALFIGTSIYKTAPLVDRYWASFSPPGFMTVFALSQMIMSSLAAMLERAISMPVLSSLSGDVKLKKIAKIRLCYRRILKLMLVLCLSTVMPIYFLAGELTKIISLIFSVGLLEAGILLNLCVIMLGYIYAAVTGVVLVTIFYAMKDTYTPTIIGMTGFIIGMFLKWLTYPVYGVEGLAACTSIYLMCNILMFVIFLEVKLEKLKNGV